MYKEPYVFTVYFNRFIVCWKDGTYAGLYHFNQKEAWDTNDNKFPCKSIEEFRAHFNPPPKLNIPYYLLPGENPAYKIAQAMLNDEVNSKMKNGCFTLFFPHQISSKDRIYKEVWKILEPALTSKGMKPTLQGLCVQVVPV